MKAIKGKKPLGYNYNTGMSRYIRAKHLGLFFGLSVLVALSTQQEYQDYAVPGAISYVGAIAIIALAKLEHLKDKIKR